MLLEELKPLEPKFILNYELIILGNLNLNMLGNIKNTG